MSHIGPPKVECWFCGKTVFKKRTTRLPNGASVCHEHCCELCGDYVRPENAQILSFGVNDEGKQITEHVCGSHRRYINECRHRGGKLVAPEEAGNAEAEGE